jgi:ABC-type nitrate/sulfonate/bicarbonate transport system ATPase subunit
MLASTEAATAPVCIGAQDLRFAFPDGGPVLAGIDLSVRMGEKIAIVGPSGCGKSTLLSLLAGLSEPAGGRLDVATDPAGHRLSMLFQKETVWPWLTVEQNVAMFARFGSYRRRAGLGWLRRRDALDDPDVRSRVNDLLKLVGLSDLGKRYPYQLSGGQLRRLAFLTSVAPNPQVLLLDEPFSALDEPTRVGIHQDVFDVLRTMNTTVVLVTHDLAEAIALSDRVLVLSNRPAIVADAFVVPFSNKRNMFELRERQAFLQLYSQLWHSLRTQIGKPASAGEPAQIGNPA